MWQKITLTAGILFSANYEPTSRKGTPDSVWIMQGIPVVKITFPAAEIIFQMGGEMPSLSTPILIMPAFIKLLVEV